MSKEAKWTKCNCGGKEDCKFVPEKITQEYKLKKIIEKGVENGWKNIEEISTIQVTKDSVFLLKSYAPKHIFFDVGEILFDKSFAKAIWGEEDAEMDNNNAWVSSSSDIDDLGKKKQVTMGGKLYELHLMKAVISDDPIDYYYENMERTI